MILPHDATWGGGPTEAELERMKWRFKKEETISSSSETDDSDENDEADEGGEENDSEESDSKESEHESGDEVSVYSLFLDAVRYFHCFLACIPVNIMYVYDMMFLLAQFFIPRRLPRKFTILIECPNFPIRVPNQQR